MSAPRPAVAFDADLRAVYARDGERWALLAARGRSTFARDQLGSMLGLSPAEIERLAPPDACGDTLCQWRSPIGDVFVVKDAARFADACASAAIVIANAAAPSDFATRCQPGALLDAPNLAAYGGATITRTPLGLRIERARPGGIL